MSNTSDFNKNRGRVNWETLHAQTQDEIDYIAKAEKQQLELDKRTYRKRVVVNVPLPDVKKIREKLGLSQASFARRFNLRERTVQQWEQGRTIPDRPARILLRVIEKSPEIVADVALALSLEERDIISPIGEKWDAEA